MLRSLTAGVTGLSTEQNAIDVISNNITNVNTVGYKSQQLDFQSLMEQTLNSGSGPQNGQGGTNPEQIGNGVSASGVTTDESEGTLNYTGKPTDLAVSGDGYFIVNNGSANYYTRDGSFDFDSQGNLIKPSNGYKVQGWTAIGGVINAEGPPSGINIPRNMVLQPQATANVALQGNLQASASSIDLAGVIQGSTTPGQPSPASPVNVAVRILNSNNELITGTLALTQEGSTENWDVSFTPDSTSAPKLLSSGTVALGKINFNPNGTVAQNNLVPLTLDYAPTDGATTQQITVDPSNLQIRTDVTSSQIGFSSTLATDPGGATAPPSGDVGIVYAGGYTMTVNFIDATGNQHTGSLIFQRDLDAQAVGNTTGQPTVWRAQFTTQDPTVQDNVTGTGAGAGPFPIDMGSVSFDQTGTLVNTSLNTATLLYKNGSTASNLKIDPGVTGTVAGLTQFQSDSTALVSNTDGYPAGTLTGVTVDPSGTVSGVFSNGQTRKLAQVALANFANPEGLNNQGSNLYIPGNNSGDPLIGTAGTGGRGAVESENLEQSNVDLAKEFSDLIVAQQAFSADARTITTSDQVLQELLQLKQ